MKNQILILAMLLAGGTAHAVEISGVITRTLSISEDSWLTGNVTCRVEQAPCISVTASNLTIWLNGFTITGQGDPTAGCLPGGAGTNIEHAISIAGQRRVEVFGPGLIQRHRGWGVVLSAGTVRTTLKDLTLSSNCISGIQLIGGASDNDLEGIVSVRNGSDDSASPCGGICLSNSNNNRIRRNILSGNGYAVMNVVNFGVALLGTSRGNVIVDNVLTGNVNGVYLTVNTRENLVHRNVITGNPPIEIPRSAQEFQGFDIRNNAPEDTNTFLDNVCLSYSGAGRSPCPSLIRP